MPTRPNDVIAAVVNASTHVPATGLECAVPDFDLRILRSEGNPALPDCLGATKERIVHLDAVNPDHSDRVRQIGAYIAVPNVSGGLRSLKLLVTVAAS
jgi:hypothetical protein